MTCSQSSRSFKLQIGFVSNAILYVGMFSRVIIIYWGGAWVLFEQKIMKEHGFPGGGEMIEIVRQNKNEGKCLSILH